MRPYLQAHGWILPTAFLVLVVPAFILWNATQVSGKQWGSPAPEAYSPETPAAAGTVLTNTYNSSVDGAPLRYHEYLPNGYNPAVPFKLAVLLPGSGGNIYQYDLNPNWTTAADAHQYILVTVEPRSLPGYPSYRWTFYMDGAVVPGEQDVLDALADVQSHRLISPSHIYIGGYSMGGIGALGIASRNPGIFAAAAPGAPMSDLFQQMAYAPVNNTTTPSFVTLFGGQPGDSAIIDTYYYENSPRFVLPNLMYTALTITHGVSDPFIPNATASWPYMQSRHIVDVPGFADSRGTASTLQKLKATWPSGFVEGHAWPLADHGGTSLLWTGEGVLSFFDQYVLNANPPTVAFSTFDDKHTRAYWLQLNLTNAWTATPGLAYATRYPLTNTLALQVSGRMTLTFDLPAMGLSGTSPLTVVVQPTNGALSNGNLAVVLKGVWNPIAEYTVMKDGLPLAADAFTVQSGRFTLSGQASDTIHTYMISVSGTPPPIFFSFLPLILR